MLKVVIAPDKFRGSLSAIEAALALGRGVRNVLPEARVLTIPMADGGEGTVAALVEATHGGFHSSIVNSPLLEPVSAEFGRLGDSSTFVIEMANASGLSLVSLDLRDPGRTTTRGTGELVLKSIEMGASRILLGLGGSATNDGGAGFGQALGYRLLDKVGNEIGPGGLELGRLDRIDPSFRDRRLDGVRIDVMCDVVNPLCGLNGASRVFGPQKGASADLIARLDENLGHFASIVERDLGKSIRDIPGAGAAGGLGGGVLAFTQATLRPGIELVIDAVGLAESLRDADLCLTGEGSIDGTSAQGKTIVGVARLAHSLDCPTLAIAGHLGPGAEAVLGAHIAAIFSLCPGPIGLDEAIRRASELLDSTAEQVVRAFLAGRDSSGRHPRRGDS